MVYTPKEPIPETLANIIGDVLGNLKSALDYAAVRIDAPGTYFPTAPRTNLPNQLSLAKLEATLPGFRDLLLNTLRPENGPDEPLWGLIGKANNENKHEDFIPTVTMVEVKGINARFGNSTLIDCAVGGDAAHPINLIGSHSPIQFSSHNKPIVNLTFGADTSVPNGPVIPILQRAADAVERALSEIDKVSKSMMRLLLPSPIGCGTLGQSGENNCQKASREKLRCGPISQDIGPIGCLRP